jgi:uncharacterized protein with von Willebrand factor type A (vWA) domain
MSFQRYGAYDGGPDPLAPPFDTAGAVDELGERVLSGQGVREALRDLLDQGTQGRRGLGELDREVRNRLRDLRRRGQLDGTLERARELLDQAVEAERGALFPDPSDDARFAEAQLDALPRDTARAVRELSEYQWRSPEAQAAYDELREMLQREVLDQQLPGLREALEQQQTPALDEEGLQRVKDMLGDLNELLGKRAQGADTQADFDAFMGKHGDLFPESPETLDELLESLARRAAAAERLMRSLSPEQQDALGQLIQQATSDLDLSSELATLNDQLRALRPDLFSRSRRTRMTGPNQMGLSDATEALAEMADLESLAEQLGQGYEGASIDDVDEDLVRRALGRRAVDDLSELRRLERTLVDEGYLVRQGGQLELSAKSVRRIGLRALQRVFSDLSALRRGGHDIRDAGASGEPTGATRAWAFGDEQPIDVVRTLANAIKRGEQQSRPLRLAVDDFEVVETERRASAAVCLLVDTSWSMVVNDTWGQAKQTALALHSLISTMYPQDALQIIGFSDYARELQPHELAGLDFAMVQGTNLQHALLMAGRFLDRHPGFDPVVLVVTDGEPTARLDRDGRSRFAWPPEPETVAATVAEVDKMTRRRAGLNMFVLGDDPRLQEFVEDVVKRNGGRMFSPRADRLGEYVVRDFLDRRRRLAR